MIVQKIQQGVLTGGSKKKKCKQPMNSTTHIIRNLKIMGGKIRASMTVIIEKDQNTTDVFEL